VPRNRATWTPLSGSERRVALEVLLHGPLARIELAKRLDLSTTSLTRLTRSLVDSGLLREATETDATARANGRPMQPLDIDPERQHFVGIKLTGANAYGVLTNLRADVIGTHQVDLPSHEPTEVAGVLAELVADLATHADEVTAIGIGLGGAVSNYTHVSRTPFLSWTISAKLMLRQDRKGVRDTWV
jgi:hypothetical protein